MPETFAEMTQQLVAAEPTGVPPDLHRLLEAGCSVSVALGILAESEDWSRMRSLASAVDSLVPPDDAGRSRIMAALSDIMHGVEAQSPRRVVLAARDLQARIPEDAEYADSLRELASELERYSSKEGLGKRREGGTRSFARAIGLEIIDWMTSQAKPRASGILDAFDDFYKRDDVRAAIQFLLDAGYISRSSASSRAWFLMTARGVAWAKRKRMRPPRASDTPPTPLFPTPTENSGETSL